MKRRPPRSTQSRSSAASDVYKRQVAPQVPTQFRQNTVPIFGISRLDLTREEPSSALHRGHPRPRRPGRSTHRVRLRACSSVVRVSYVIYVISGWDGWVGDQGRSRAHGRAVRGREKEPRLYDWALIGTAEGPGHHLLVRLSLQPG